MSVRDYPEKVTGGIPPDPDHRRLFVCCFEGCDMTQDDEPLIVAAAGGKMATFCRAHYDHLTGMRQPFHMKVGTGGSSVDELLDAVQGTGWKRYAVKRAELVEIAARIRRERAEGVR